jgi:hypothetical protein
MEVLFTMRQTPRLLTSNTNNIKLSTGTFRLIQNIKYIVDFLKIM